MKLVGVTKVPLILTLSQLTPEAEASLIKPLKELGIAFDLVKYKYMKMSPMELVASLKLIVTFEELIANTIEDDEFDKYTEK
jgi:hypothetical protein